MRDERFRLLIDVRVLLVGADYILALPPQGVHRIELGGAFGQPEQLDPQSSRHSLRRLRGMAAVAVKQQGYVPAAVPLADLK